MILCHGELICQHFRKFKSVLRDGKVTRSRSTLHIYGTVCGEYLCSNFWIRNLIFVSVLNRCDFLGFQMPCIFTTLNYCLLIF
jgi:hypothetical protein